MYATTEPFEKIQEPIRVIASFNGPKVKLHSFEWRNRIYKVDSVNLFHIEKDADRRLYHFNTSSGGNDYDIVFNPANLSWKLQEVIDI